jgi:hypothetical protein
MLAATGWKAEWRLPEKQSAKLSLRDIGKFGLLGRKGPDRLELRIYNDRRQTRSYHELRMQRLFLA